MIDDLRWSHGRRPMAMAAMAAAAFALAAVLPVQPGLAAQSPGEPVLAPLGVPTRNVATAEAPRELPASFRVRVALPSFVGPEVKLDLVSLGPGGEPIDGAGNLPGLPRTAFLSDDGLVMRRLSASPTDEGSHWYESEVVVAIADLRAARAYARTPAENAANAPGGCIRCDQAALGIPAEAREILSGETIRARFPPALVEQLAPIYDEEALRRGEPTLRSVRWEIAPGLRQDPANNASGGSGDVVPGTLLHSGEFTHGAVDLSVRGRGIDVAFARSYRNQAIGAGPLGPGWEMGYRLRLRPLPDGNVELYDGSGRRETFTRQSDDSLKSPTGVFAELVETPEGYLLIDPVHTTVTFDLWGRLVALADAVKDRETAGNAVRFSYDRASRLVRVVDDLLRAYDLAYDDAGHLESITDFGGRTVRYVYDDEGRLARVISPGITVGESTFPNGLATEYEYVEIATADGLAAALASRDNLVAAHDARGATPWEVTYTDADGDGRAEEATAESWGEHALSIDYDFTSHTAAVTDRRGEVWHYQHNPSGQLLRFEDPTGAPTTYTVDGEGLVTKVTLPLGRVTDIVYDTSGERRGRGNVLSVAVTADSRGDNGSAHTLRTTYEYEGYSNQPLMITDPRGAVTKIVRNHVGLPTSVTEAFEAPEAGTTTTDYNVYGQPTRVTNPNGHVTTYDYFATGPEKGYLHQQTVDPAGLALVTAFDVEERGNVTAVTDPRGVRHESVYNEVDWLVESTQAASGATSALDPEGLAPALGFKTAYLYDEIGQVIEERLPAGDDGTSFTRVQRDYGVLGQLLEERREVTAGAGDWISTQRTYDENFNLRSITGPEGEVTEQTFDERNLLEAVTRGSGTPEAATELSAYDSEGNRTLFTDAVGHSLTTAFDGFGRVKSATDPLGNRTVMTYDNGSKVVDSRSLDSVGSLLAQSGSIYDLRGRPKSSTARLWSGSDATGARVLTTSTDYDAAGNALSMTDAMGRVSHHTFDAAERRVTASDPIGNRTEWVLDGAGNARTVTLVEQVTGSGGGGPISTTVAAAYDALGRPVAASDPLGNRTTTTYDARGNVRLAIDPEGHFTESTYDGLDRLTRTVRPEGISVDYGYDESSRLVTYRDALNQTTTWTYDSLGRKRSTTYPDATQESIDYDAAGNPNQLVDANGTLVTQGFDAANRLASRTIVRGEGVEGPTAEIFAYDGLSRLTQVQSGSHVTSHTYDSLSRRLTETTNGKTIAYQHDDAGNATQQAYPSGTNLTYSFDALNRLQAVTSGTEQQVTYGFRGADLVASKSFGNGLAGTTTYDPARRPTRSTLGGSNFDPFTELLSWSPRNLKTAVQREDLNGQGYLVAYDAAGRLIEAAKTENPLAQAPNNSTPAVATVEALPHSFAFTYDVAENLLEQRPERYTVASSQASPPDGSGRNRPGSFAGQALAWDANGNLIRKGPIHFAWDYRNRLTRVTRDGVGEIALYEYDAFNRLTTRVVAGEAHSWVWAGWQLLERYADGELAMRRVYGQGLDEVVRQETDGDGDGVLETVTIPVYDSIGNAVAITDESGKAIERYEYAPYGTRTIRVDLTPPAIEQLREADGRLLLEFSEEILLHRVQVAIASGDLTLRDTAEDEPVAITASQPVRDGIQKGRRLLLTPDSGSLPEANHGMLLHIEPSAMVDLFENRPAMAYDKPFVWLAADHTIDDTTPPRVDLVLTKAGELEIGFSEEIDPVIASAVILLDGATRAWTALPDGYTLKPAGAISATTHTLQIGPALIDKAGNPMAEPFSQNVTTGATDHIAYERPDPRITPTSTLDNLASFQGHVTDPATGLVYMRNRWMDPEMGRFLSVDPLGYRDGPSEYESMGSNPLSIADPLGRYQTDFHFYVVYYAAFRALGDESRATTIAWASQYVDNSPLTQPVPNGWRFGSPLLESFQEDVLRPFHFLGIGKAPTFPGLDNPLSHYLFDQVASAPDDVQLGVLLHAFADTYSHAGFSAFSSDENECGVFNILPQIGHGECLTAPDEPYQRPALAAAAAIAIERLVRDYESKRTGLPSTPIADEPQLRKFYLGEFSRLTNPDEHVRAASWRRTLALLGVSTPLYEDGLIDGSYSEDLVRRFLIAQGLQRSLVRRFDLLK